jgi:hypothetical protein
MSAEFIAIIVTAVFQSSLLMVGLWMSYRLGKILEHTQALNAAILREMREQPEGGKDVKGDQT